MIEYILSAVQFERVVKTLREAAVAYSLLADCEEKQKRIEAASEYRSKAVACRNLADELSSAPRTIISQP